MSDNHENLKETLHEAHKERVQEREELKKGARETRKEIKEMRKKKLSFKELLKVTFSLSEDNASPEEVRDRILSGGKVTGQNAFMLMLAILIASVGLNTNSTAIIIGAMLISPLMGSILALAYGTVVRDGAIIRRYGMGLITQIVISLLTSTVYFLLSPVKGPTSELLARTTPTFFDVIVAVCGGLAGIIANTRGPLSLHSERLLHLLLRRNHPDGPPPAGSHGNAGKKAQSLYPEANPQHNLCIDSLRSHSCRHGDRQVGLADFCPGNPSLAHARAGHWRTFVLATPPWPTPEQAIGGLLLKTSF